MMGIDELCTVLAAALSEVDGVTVLASPAGTLQRPGDGWIEVSRVRPAGFGDQAEVQLTVPVLLATSHPAASQRFREVAWALVSAATIAIPCACEVTPQVLTLDSGGGTYAAVLTITTEV